MKSIFNDLNLIKQFEQIVKISQQAQPEISFDAISKGVDELFKNLRSQFVFTQEGDAEELDILKDLKNLESFLLFLYKNTVKYNGADIVGTYGTGVGPGGLGEYSDVDTSPQPPAGYARYEREKKYQINVAGIWAYLNNLLTWANTNNTKAVPYIKNIMDQLNQAGIKSTPTPSPPSTTAPSASAPGTAATPGAGAASGVTPAAAGAGVGGLTNDQTAALRILANMIKNGGPLYRDEIRFDEIDLYLKNIAILYANNSSHQQYYSQYQKNYNDVYQYISSNSILSTSGRGWDTAIQIFNGLQVATMSASDLPTRYSAITQSVLPSLIRYVLATLIHLQKNYLSNPEYTGHFRTQAANGDLNITFLQTLVSAQEIAKQIQQQTRSLQ